MEFKWINETPYVVGPDGELRVATPYELEQEGYHD
jgi:hypothetical protein